MTRQPILNGKQPVQPAGVIGFRMSGGALCIRREQSAQTGRSGWRGAFGRRYAIGLDATRMPNGNTASSSWFVGRHRISHGAKRDGSRINRSLAIQTRHSLLEQSTRYTNRTPASRTEHSLHEQDTRYASPRRSRRLHFAGTRGNVPLVPLLTRRLKTIAFSPLTRGPSTVFRATGGFNHDCFCRDRRRQRVAPEIRGLVFCTGRVS